MAFYSGSANSFSDLKAALVTACTDNGWTVSGNVLSKGSAHAELTVSNADSASFGIGLLIRGGTDSSGGVLVNPSVQHPRMGAPSRSISLATFPMSYTIHLNTEPDEVYIVAKYSLDFHLFMGFGVSDAFNPVPPANGMWMAASCRRYRGNTGAAVKIRADGGGGGRIDHTSSSFAGMCAGFFWDTDSGDTSALCASAAVCTGLETLWPHRPSSGNTGTPPVGEITAARQAAPHVALSPNVWNSEAILLPIQVYEARPSSKQSLVVDLKHARYIRVDNYVSGQIITLGPDKWMVYPFYKKNSVDRNGDPGGGFVDHTGTFGWAIRYDGP